MFDFYLSTGVVYHCFFIDSLTIYSHDEYFQLILK